MIFPDSKFASFILVFLADFLSYIYIFLKIYRVLCFTKLTFDQLPLFNPYQWPLSVIRIITKPYFTFWDNYLPSLKIGMVAYNISPILALEFLANLSKIFLHLKLAILIEAQRILL